MKRKLLVVLASAILFLGFSAVSSLALTSTYVIGRPIQGSPAVYVTPYQNHPTFVPVSGVPCIKRPACLDAHPSCMIAEPAGGWCKTPSVTPLPTPVHCGGFVRNAPTCPAGYVCKLGRIPDAGGTCVPSVSSIPSRTPSAIPVAVTAKSPAPSPIISLFNGFTGFFTRIFFFWRR